MRIIRIKFQVHQLMLKDITRTKAYKDAIFSNKEYLKGKTIMDVGAGTGMLNKFVPTMLQLLNKFLEVKPPERPIEY